MHKTHTNHHRSCIVIKLLLLLLLLLSNIVYATQFICLLRICCALVEFKRIYTYIYIYISLTRRILNILHTTHILHKPNWNNCHFPVNPVASLGTKTRQNKKWYYRYPYCFLHHSQKSTTYNQKKTKRTNSRSNFYKSKI